MSLIVRKNNLRRYVSLHVSMNYDGAISVVIEVSDFTELMQGRSNGAIPYNEKSLGQNC